jgi:hypothetical protein
MKEKTSSLIECHNVFHRNWRTPKLLDGLNCKSKGEDNGRRRSWGALFGSQHFRGRKVCWSSRMGPWRAISNSIIHADLHKSNNKLVSAMLNFGAHMNNGQKWTHKTHHSLNSGEATTFPLTIYFVHGHRASTQMSFCLETHKWESWNSKNWDSRNFGGP